LNMERHILLALLILLVLPLALLQSALAAQITIAWDAQSRSTGYNVYYRTASGVYGSPIVVGNVTTYTFDLSPGQRYFIAVTAYNPFGESGYSDELNVVGLTTSVNPPGVGTVNPSGVTWYNSGQGVSVSATANIGYTFNGWSGDLSGSTNPSSVVMNWPKNVTANFNSGLSLIGNLENPSEGQKVSGITTIHGWAIDGNKVTKVELYVDGTYAGDIPYGGSREDVRDVYPQYPDADLSGFGMIMNYSILSPGNHNIVARLYNQDGQTKDLASIVTVVRFHGDFATQVIPDSFWLNNVNVTIEGVTRTYDIQVQWSNALQGFEIKEIVLKGGSSFNLTNKDSIKPLSQSFPMISEPLSTLPLLGYLENPSEGQKVSGITTIHGWAIDGTKVTKVELFVDGTYAGDIPYGGSREDVRDVYPQYPNADLSGFGMIMNYSILSPGSYNIVVRLNNQDGQTKDLASAVTVVRFHGDFATQVTPDSFWLNNVNVTIEGVTRTYDIQVQWFNASQGFEIKEIVPKGD